MPGGPRINKLFKFLGRPPEGAKSVRVRMAVNDGMTTLATFQRDEATDDPKSVAALVDEACREHAEELGCYVRGAVEWLSEDSVELTTMTIREGPRSIDGASSTQIFDGSAQSVATMATRHCEAMMKLHVQGSASTIDSLTRALDRATDRAMAEERRANRYREEIDALRGDLEGFESDMKRLQEEAKAEGGELDPQAKRILQLFEATLLNKLAAGVAPTQPPKAAPDAPSA